MSKLADHLLTPGMRVRVVNDCAVLVELHARTMKGVHGIMTRTVFATIKAFQPDIIPSILDKLLPSFVKSVNELYTSRTQETVDQETDISEILMQNPAEVVEMLLGICDLRIATVQSQAIRLAYLRLRRFAEREVTDALPQLVDQLRIWMADNSTRSIPYFE